MHYENILVKFTLNISAFQTPFYYTKKVINNVSLVILNILQQENINLEIYLNFPLFEHEMQLIVKLKKIKQV